MQNEEQPEMNAVILPVLKGRTVADTTQECSTVCYHPECACRERIIAGCDVPIASELLER